MPIIKTVIFCGQQNIPMRGHRDDGALSENRNEGHFRALIKFRIDAGDTDLKHHIETMPKNATYISKTIQNAIIKSCKSVILSKIVRKIEKSVFFSILVDETTDMSVKEQMSLCIRYFDVEENRIREDFISFIEMSSCTGQTIYSEIKTILERLGLDINNVRGQGYDGAANMSGYKEGVQALIKKRSGFSFIHPLLQSLP